MRTGEKENGKVKERNERRTRDQEPGEGGGGVEETKRERW